MYCLSSDWSTRPLVGFSECAKAEETTQENIGDQLLRDENISIDDISENVKIDDDKISISSVEEASKMQKAVKRKFMPSKVDFLLQSCFKASSDIF